MIDELDELDEQISCFFAGLNRKKQKQASMETRRKIEDYHENKRIEREINDFEILP